MLATEGIPVFFLELEIDQWLRKVVTGVWDQVSPYLDDNGISSVVMSFSVALY